MPSSSRDACYIFSISICVLFCFRLIFSWFAPGGCLERLLLHDIWAIENNVNIDNAHVFNLVLELACWRQLVSWRTLRCVLSVGCVIWGAVCVRAREA